MASEPSAPAASSSGQPLLTTPTATLSPSPFKPAWVGTSALGQREVERLPRIEEDGGVLFPSPLNFNPSTYAWDNKSAKPGSTKGVIILTAHTYSRGASALGNRLTATLKPGDVITVTGQGQTARYQVVSKETYGLAAYTQLANAWLDSEVAPLLTVTVCADYDPVSKDWDSRIVWSAVPMK